MKTPCGYYLEIQPVVQLPTVNYYVISQTFFVAT
jgi:hypothetical protein